VIWVCVARFNPSSSVVRKESIALDCKTITTLKTVVFWDVITCSLIEVYLLRLLYDLKFSWQLNVVKYSWRAVSVV
jgi:hypothetical protein